MLRTIVLAGIAVVVLGGSAVAPARAVLLHLADADRGTTCHVTKTEPVGDWKLKCTYLCRTANGDVTLHEEFDKRDMIDDTVARRPATTTRRPPPAALIIASPVGGRLLKAVHEPRGHA